MCLVTAGWGSQRTGASLSRSLQTTVISLLQNEMWSVKLRTCMNLLIIEPLLNLYLDFTCKGLHTSSNVAAWISCAEFPHHTLANSDWMERWCVTSPVSRCLQMSPVLSQAAAASLAFLPTTSTWGHRVTHVFSVVRLCQVAALPLEIEHLSGIIRPSHKKHVHVRKKFDRCIHRVGWTYGLYIKSNEATDHDFIVQYWNQGEIPFLSKHERKTCTHQQFPGPLVCWPNSGWLPLRLQLICSIGTHIDL